MKKYTLFLFIFAFILLGFLSFNVNFASASNCAVGDLFNSSTGQACGINSSSSSRSAITTNRTIIIGSRGADVRSVQQVLKDYDYYRGALDGNYGRRTARAVKDFQDDNDLAITGNVDAATLAILNSFGTLVTNSANTTNQSSSTSNITNTTTTATSSTTTTASDATLSASLLSTSVDRAGTHEIFRAGPGNTAFNYTNEDWNIRMNLTLGSQKTISAIVLDHNTGGEGWSTSRSATNTKTGKWLYPLVVYKENSQLNNAYDSVWPAYVPATYNLTLYAQKESRTFTGGNLVVYFTDGTSVSTTVSGGTVSATSATVSSQPTITSISPSSGPLGTSITIAGTHFSRISDNNITLVPTSGTSFHINAHRPGSGGTLAVVIPTYSTSWPDGTVFKIFVDNDEFGFGDQNVDYKNNPKTFRVTTDTVTSQSIPTITVSSPNGGQSFNKDQNPITLSWNVSPASAVDVSIISTFASKVFSVQLPSSGDTSTNSLSLTTSQAHAIPDGQYFARVCQIGTTNCKDSVSFTITSSTPTQPIITSLSASSGPVGTLVTVNTRNYADQLNNALHFQSVNGGGTSFSARTNANGLIQFTVPNYSAGVYNVSVDSDLNGDSNTVQFTITAPNPSPAQQPTITSISPTSGPLGTSITLSGTHFSTISDNNVTLDPVADGVSSFIINAHRPGSGGTLAVVIPNYSTSWPVGTVFKIFVDNDEYGFGDQNATYNANPKTFTVTAAASVSSLDKVLNSGSLTANAISGTENNSTNENVVRAEKFHFIQFLEQGAQGNEVRELQKFLNGAGYDAGKVDGVFGVKVKEALIKLQIANNLKGDGIVGYEVRTFLNK